MIKSYVTLINDGKQVETEVVTWLSSDWKTQIVSWLNEWDTVSISSFKVSETENTTTSLLGWKSSKNSSRSSSNFWPPGWF